jgi:hypothetical protein
VGSALNRGTGAAPHEPFFIVGCPRSGTTLLKSMLDGHPRVAIPHESHFILGLAPRPARPAGTIDDIIGHSWFRRWDIDPDVVQRAAAADPAPSTWPELVSRVFETYAASRGKPRWGDRTPGYVAYLPQLHRLFPDAYVIHVIRDGRDVAASLVERSWGPDHIVTGAFWWRTKVRTGRRDGAATFGDRYLEVRLEDLVADAPAALQRVCSFLGEDYDAAMLAYPERVRATVLERGRAVRHLVEPPTSGLRDWRAGVSRDDQRAVEAVCRTVLAEFGYQREPRDDPALLRAYLIRARSLLRHGPAATWARLRPATRDY